MTTPFRFTSILILAAGLMACATQAEETEAAPQMTIGNGEANAIQIDGLTRVAGDTVFSEVRVDGDRVVTRRANSTAIVVPEVVIAQNGWVVLHPVMDGSPNGDVVSGYAYVSEGANADVVIPIDHPADTGDMFLIMLHGDVDGDKVFDFVFTGDTHVEDKAVFEGTKMIAHIIAVP